MTEEVIFNEAIARSPPDRGAYLDQACAGDPALRAAVEALLRANIGATGFLKSPPAGSAATVDVPSREGPGTLVGPYKLLQQIGEGGMGVVFMAEQTAPVRRKVALKVLKPGMDSRQVLARFEAERQALALMDHPNIARVFDAGTTADGRPYFVMELVRGRPITKHCDEHRLGVRERLGLFADVCRAVQHAHQKGIIHRDLKPSNVLVAPYDGQPVVKVIDFGVAKAAGARLTDQTLFTEFGAVVGTLEYMSPEQAELNNQDIDTRSDVYSLGVLLYELLTGTTPVERKRLRDVALLEMLRVIRDEEPARPSTRLGTTEDLQAISAQRQTDPAKLTRLVRGELDWIVMKALDKDRNRRYDTANGFAMDVQRYLAGDAVLACPASTGYRLKKLWQRKRGLVVATALVFICLVGGIAGTSWGLVRAVGAQNEAEGEATAARQARRAEELQREFADKEKARAEENLKQARSAVDKLFTRVAQDLANKPHMEEIRRVLLVDALQFYQGFLAQKATDPVMRNETARAYSRVGDIQQMLGHTPEAVAAMRQAVALTKKLVDDFPGVPAYRVDLVRFRVELASILHWTLRPEEDAELRRQALSDAQKLAADFPTVPSYQRLVAGAETDLGNALRDPLGRLNEAEQHYRQGVAAWKKLEADYPKEAIDYFGVSHSRLWLGQLLSDTGRLVEAEPELRQAVVLRERLVAQSPDDAGPKANLAHAQANLAKLLNRSGKPSQAVETFQRAVAIREKLRDDFPRDAEYQRRLEVEYSGLAKALLALGRTQEAEDAHRRALAVVKKLVADHPGMNQYRYSSAWCYYDLGLLLSDTKRPQDAADAFRQARVAFDESAAKAPESAKFQGALAWFLATCPVPQFRDANRAVEAAKRALQRDPASTIAWSALGIAHYRGGAWQAALEALTKAYDLSGGGNSAEWFFIAMVHWQRGNKEEARRWYQQAVDWMQKHQPGDPDWPRFRAEAAELLGITE
jgi:eukaryotic-like serine/threonine-protein kinase